MEWIDTIISALGGLSIIITGIVAYIGKLYFERFKASQNTTNRELQASIDATHAGLKSKLENCVYVTKTHFDKEFSAYSSIWSAMFELKESVVALRPVLDYVDKSESLEDRKLRRLRRFKESYNLLVANVESNRPFIPSDIYTDIRNFQQQCRKESIEYEHSNIHENRMSYWKDAEINVKEVINIFDVVCEMIRNRLYKLSVIE